MKKVYLILQRHIVSVRKNRVIWSEWYLNSCNAFYSLHDCEDALMRLRSSVKKNGFDNIDYCFRFVFVK